MLLSVYNQINNKNQTMLEQLQQRVVNKLGKPSSIKTWRSRVDMHYSDVTVMLDAFYDNYEVYITKGEHAVAWCDDIDKALEHLDNYVAA